MDRIVTFKLNGNEYHFLYSGDAMFVLQEEVGDPSDIMSILGGKGRKMVKALHKCAIVMSEAGELYRKYMGYEKGPVLTEKDLALLPVLEAMDLRTSLIQALVVGIQREEKDENEEVDLGLAEIEEKKD